MARTAALAGRRLVARDARAYVPQAELERLRALDGDPYERAAAFADACRLNALYMIAARRLRPPRHDLQLARHRLPGCTSRCCGTATATSPRRATTRPASTRCSPRSAGSTSSSSTAAAAGRAAGPPGRRGNARGRDQHRLARHGHLEGAGLRARRPARGPLGPRLRAHRRRRAPGGPVLGVAPAGGERGLDEITVIVDHNKVQSDTWVDQVSDLGDLEAKVRAFGWAVAALRRPRRRSRSARRSSAGGRDSARSSSSRGR